MDKVFQKFLRSGIDLSPVKITTHTFARQKVHLFLAGRVWTASTSALFETLAV